ncbi:MAG: hypothetical protein KAG64_00290 [Bacteroidales bacterium]|nr:hypothetical protein [Bacteroidales bacterium]
MLKSIKLIYLTNFLLLVVFMTGICKRSYAQAKPESTNELNYYIEFIEENKIEKAEESIRTYLESDLSTKEKIKSCYNIAIAYNNNQYYNLSIEYSLEGLGYLNNNSKYLLPQLYQAIIINHIDLGNYDLAESFYWVSSKLQAEKEKNIEAADFNLIGEIHRLKGMYKSSIKYFHKAIKINSAYNYVEPLSINYNNIGLSFLYMDNIDSSYFYLNHSLHLIDSLGLALRKSAINVSFGELYLKKGNYTQAINYFRKTLGFDLSNHPDQNEILRDVYKGLMESYELMGDFENALKNYKNYIKYETNIIYYKQNALILQNQILSDRDAHLHQINLTRSKLDLEKKINQLISILLVIALLMVVLLSYVFMIRIKKSKQTTELELQKNEIQALELEKTKLSKKNLEFELKQIEQEQNLKKIERIRLEEKVQSQNRELTSQAIHLMSKNEVLSSIEQNISKISDKADILSSKFYREIKFIISDSLRMDEDWQIFRRHFTEVHPLFFENLKTNYSNITTDELKLCAYLKIQLSSKEIARLLNITTVAVNKRRNRLRKKLEISSNDDFYGFFLRKEF